MQSKAATQLIKRDIQKMSPIHRGVKTPACADLTVQRIIQAIVNSQQIATEIRLASCQPRNIVTFRMKTETSLKENKLELWE